MAGVILREGYQRRDRSAAPRNDRRPAALRLFEKGWQLVASFFRTFMDDFHRWHVYVNCTVRTARSQARGWCDGRLSCRVSQTT
jgi:hypothetical protein